MGKGMTYSHRGQSYELWRGIHTDRSDSHHEGPVPMTYLCPQLSSWLVQVLVVTLAKWAKPSLSMRNHLMTPIFQLNWLILQFINIISDLLCLLSGLSQTWYVFISHVFFLIYMFYSCCYQILYTTGQLVNSHPIYVRVIMHILLFSTPATPCII